MIVSETPNIELLNCDCMEYMKTVPDKALDLAIVDPPYGIGEAGQRNVTGDRPTVKWKNPKSINYKTFDDSTPPSFEYFKELQRVSKNQIIWGGNYFTDLLPQSSKWLWWDKCQTMPTYSDGELAWTSLDGVSVKKIIYNNNGLQSKEKDRVHPTQKPRALYEWLLEKYCKPSWKILDTHLGSGLSAIVAEKMGFDFVGCEIDKDYYEAAVKRFKKETD